MPTHRVILGDALRALRAVPANTFDAVVTDPPYGLSFMGKAWDYDVPTVELWREVLRVLKPGGHLLAFAGTRTQHRMAVNIEDAGFDIRDMIAWVYGSGFPKSLDVSKAIDGTRGTQARRFNAAGIGESNGGSKFRSDHPDFKPYAPATEAARQWQGWGTALKPALELVTVARKPLVGTVADNVTEWGTGALNIDGCRIAANDGYAENRVTQGGDHFSIGSDARTRATTFEPNCAGRWPANLIHDGSEEVTACFPQAPGQQGPVSYTAPSAKTAGIYGAMARERGKRPGGFGGVGAPKGDSTPNGPQYLDSGSAARFFYCAKASRSERGEGNTHPTVKPLALMRYLCRLVTPPGGLILDPFLGSGTTSLAAHAEGFASVGIEADPDHVRIVRERFAAAGIQYAGTHAKGG